MNGKGYQKKNKVRKNQTNNQTSKQTMDEKQEDSLDPNCNILTWNVIHHMEETGDKQSLTKVELGELVENSNFI